jgi:small subunit ribosomal protein S17
MNMKIFQGKIIGMKMDKTISVEVERILAHSIYKKRFKRSKKYHVHSENAHKIGDIVNFVECPPISKSKRWIEVGKGKVKK